MHVIFRNFATKHLIARHRIDAMLHIPRMGEVVKFIDDTFGRVVDVEYYLGSDIGQIYEKIEIVVEVFEKEADTPEYPTQAPK